MYYSYTMQTLVTTQCCEHGLQHKDK